MFKKSSILYASSIFVVIMLATAFPAAACGNQKIVSVPVPANFQSQDLAIVPQVLDAWTTNDINNPFTEVYEFNNGTDTLALVTYYSHEGGIIPQQTSASFYTGTKNIFSNCKYNWGIPLPPGEYLLINYYPAVTVGQTPKNLDWGIKVGDSPAFGYPDTQNILRPFPFTIKKP
jgi:hypothetical protein